MRMLLLGHKLQTNIVMTILVLDVMIRRWSGDAVAESFNADKHCYDSSCTRHQGKNMGMLLPGHIFKHRFASSCTRYNFYNILQTNNVMTGLVLGKRIKRWSGDAVFGHLLQAKRCCCWVIYHSQTLS